MGLLDRWRYRNAFKFGKLEHILSKILGALLMGVSVYLLFSEGGGPRLEGLKYLWFSATLLWIFGWLFHKLERWLHPG